MIISHRNCVTNISDIFFEGFSSAGFQHATISCASSSCLLGPLHLQDSIVHPLVFSLNILHQA